MRLGLRLVVLAFALLVPSAVSAQGGINLSWDDCGASGAGLKFFACDSNAGSSTLYVSAVTSVSMPQLNGVSIVIDIQTSATELSDWWKMSSGGCRVSAITGNMNFTSGPFSCYDVWAGRASGGVSYTPAFGGPNRARLRGVAAIPGTTPAPETAEMYLFAFRISHEKSTGEGSCAGCTDKAVLVLNSVLLTQPIGVGNYTLTAPLNSGYASWRCSAWLGKGGLEFSCTSPTKKNSWGAIKSLYR